MASDLDALLRDIRACRLCDGLIPEPRPVLRASVSARLAIFSQAPGTKVHAGGMPFIDASGDRLRAWMGVDKATFYDESRIAIVPMGFCFPGQDAKGGDLPPRPECARTWRAKVMAHLPKIELVLVVGSYAQKWHLGPGTKPTLHATVSAWREYAPRYFPLPHPSWRNNAWIKGNPWFEAELLPHLRAEVARVLQG